MIIIVLLFIVVYIIGFLISVDYFTTDRKWGNDEYWDEYIPLNPTNARKVLIWPLIVSLVIINSFYKLAYYTVKFMLKFIKLIRQGDKNE